MADSNSMNSIRKLLATAEPANLGPTRRSGTEPAHSLNAALDSAFGQSAIDRRSRELIRSLVLLWHDHLDESHAISQGIENADGSFVHGIMHRREPDYGNSSYWFRRVGKPPCFPEIASRVQAVLQSESIKLAGAIIPNGEWNPFGFIDACRQAASGSLSEQESQTLRRIQKMEFEALLDCFLRR